MRILPRLKWSYLKEPRKTLRLVRLYFLREICHANSLKSIRRTLTPIREPQKWVFIVGCYNSGTTLLQEVVGQHPDISTLVEGVFCTDELITPEELGWPRMWHKVIDQVSLNADDMRVDAQALKKDWSLFLDTKKPIFLEKSIVNSARMLWLQENFCNSYFIYIVRNGYAVAEGIQRKIKVGRRWPIPEEFKSTYPIDLCAKQWVINNQVIELDSHQIKNFFKLSYEEFCEHPDKCIEQIWNFIGLNTDDLTLNMTTTWQIHEKSAPIQNMNQPSIDRLTEQQILAIENIAKETLQEYGYPILSLNDK